MFIKKNSFYFILFGFILVNLFFNFNQYWKEVFYDSSKSDRIVGETQATEWGFNEIYKKILNFENPFTSFDQINYPFGIDTIGGDIGTALFYPLLRPFLSSHQTLSLLIILGIFLSNLGMFLLLKKLKITNTLSFILSLAYGFMTFIQPRVGHPIYIFALFLFPWFYLSGLFFICSNNNIKKIIYSLFLSFFYTLCFWINSYYFIILTISIGCLAAYFLFFERKNLIYFIKSNYVFIFLFLALFLIFNIPWFIVSYQTFLFSELPQSVGWGGAIDFSSDLFGFFIPSIYNYYYGNLVYNITKNIAFAKGIFEQFTYPGIIIIFSYFLLIYFWINNRLSNKTKRELKPYLLISLVFFILTLGPFLHILGNWYIQLEDGIRLVIPLPFIFLHYIPFLGNIRAPGRLIVGFIFFAYIVSAYLITYLLKNKNKKTIVIFYFTLFVIFIIDHRPLDIVERYKINPPKKIYNLISNNKEHLSVLEIPFVIRDGFTYFGDYNSVNNIFFQSYFNKPVIGIYAGRIPNYIKEYFKRDPFIGYLGRNIDKNIKSNLYINNTDLLLWRDLNIEKSLDSIDFLSIKYIILYEKRKFSNKIKNLLPILNFEKVLSEKDYSLWKREINKKNFIDIDILEKNSKYIGMGWYDPEIDFRWASRRSSILFKSYDIKKATLKFKVGSFYKDLNLSIYLNREKIKKINIKENPDEYMIELNNINKGINFIHFIFNEGFRPNEVIQGSLDKRKLSGKFYKIDLISD